MLNNIEVEDLGIKIEEFTLEKKKKFIQNSNSQLIEGIKIIKEIFLILGVYFDVNIDILERSMWFKD